jgi:hypothetical protein
MYSSAILEIWQPKQSVHNLQLFSCNRSPFVLYFSSANDCASITSAASQFWPTVSVLAVSMGSAGVDPSTYLQCLLDNQANLFMATPFGPFEGTLPERQLHFAISYGKLFCKTNHHQNVIKLRSRF